MAQSTLILEKQSNWKPSFLGLEGIAYFFQGFYIVGLQIYITVQMASVWHLDFATVAIVTAIMGIPTFLKMFSGLISDRVWLGRWGRRKPFIVVGALLYLPSFLLLISVQDFGALWLFTIALAMTAWMIVDSTLDALTVDITPKEEVSRMQGAAFGGRMIGVALSSLIVTQLAPIIGWSTMLLIIGAFAGIQSITALLFRELPLTKEQIYEHPVAYVFKKAFGSKTTWLGFIFVMFFIAATSLTNLVGVYILAADGLAWEGFPYGLQIYGLANLFYSGSAAVGSILFGTLAKRYLSNKQFYWAVVLVVGILHVPWLLVAPGVDPLLVYFAMATSGLGRGIVVVLVYSVVMRLCPDSIEGFAFATFSSFMNIGDLVIGTNLIAQLELLFGINLAFIFIVPIALIGILAVMPLVSSFSEVKSEPEFQEPVLRSDGFE